MKTDFILVSSDRIKVIKELRRVTKEALPVCIKWYEEMSLGHDVGFPWWYRFDPTIINAVPVREIDPEDQRRTDLLALLASGSGGNAEDAVLVCKKLSAGEYAWIFQAYA